MFIEKRKETKEQKKEQKEENTKTKLPSATAPKTYFIHDTSGRAFPPLVPCPAVEERVLTAKEVGVLRLRSWEASMFAVDKKGSSSKKPCFYSKKKSLLLFYILSRKVL